MSSRSNDNNAINKILVKQSELVGKSIREIPKEEDSINAQLLIRGGFIDKVTSGVYTYLPLGLKTLNKISNIVREEMDAIGGQEILMSVLSPSHLWQQTGRWDTFNALFRMKGAGDKEYGLNPTHEEIVTPLVKKMVFSYKDLPLYVYQIQTKLRNEPRAKSGLLRGREFLMKDLYSFHASEADLDEYYEVAKGAYKKIWQRLGIGAITLETYASGGAFSKYSHEYQTLATSGEDTIYVCEKCQLAINKELIGEQNTCPQCDNKNLKEKTAIEVGNIFKLMTKFSDSFDFTFTDRDGKNKPVFMGCYGIGPSRIMGTLVEIFHDTRGIIWPEAVAPFRVHLLDFTKGGKGLSLYNSLVEENIEILYDDREETPGVKLKDADLIGIPWRIIAGDKHEGKFEIKRRDTQEIELMSEKEIINLLKTT
jgi:prolyl-tRNA synthetase